MLHACDHDAGCPPCSALCANTIGVTGASSVARPAIPTTPAKIEVRPSPARGPLLNKSPMSRRHDAERVTRRLIAAMILARRTNQIENDNLHAAIMKPRFNEPYKHRTCTTPRRSRQTESSIGAYRRVKFVKCRSTDGNSAEFCKKCGRMLLGAGTSGK